MLDDQTLPPAAETAAAFIPTASASPNAILQLGTGFWASKTLLSAVELGVFTELGHGPLDAETLRKRLGLHERAARDFLDALVSLGMLERKNGRYANTAASDHFLDRNKPFYIGGLLEMFNRRLYGFWGSLTEGLKTGKPQNEITQGGPDLFASIYGDPAALESFSSAMTGLSLPAAHRLAEILPWNEHQTVIDIGAAQGGVPVVLAQHHAHLSGGGFDLPPVRPVFEKYVRANGLADRLRFYPGDFFRDPLPSADVLIMGHILHDWDLPARKVLIEKCLAALPKGGRLVVYDMMLDDERWRNTAGLLMSLNMLIETPGGSEYTGADCVGWMREAGFAEAAVTPLVGPYSAVVGIR
jgi:SAM-dependent methyltransferase